MKILKLTNEVRKLQKKAPGFEVDFSQVQPFLFSQLPTEMGEPPEDFPEDGILSVPFPVWSYEMVEGFVTADRETGIANVSCVCVQEVTPGFYNFIVLVESPYGKGIVVVHCDPKDQKMMDAYKSLMGLTQHYLERIHSEQNGVFESKGKGSYKFKGQNRQYKIGTVVYVGNPEKDNVVHFTTGTKRKIDWTHKWNVRGHWRKLSNPDTLGKDRAGRERVRGFTWINSYTKGEGDLVEKTRKVL